MQLEQGGRGNSEKNASIALELTIDETRWLVAALTIALRLLEGLRFDSPEGQHYQLSGLAALHRIADRLPRHIKGHYP